MYPEFITLLNNYDVVCFDETKLDDLDTVELDNFIFHFKNRKKYSNRKSGGIAFGYKRYLENCITPIQTDCPFWSRPVVQWFSIDEKIFDLKSSVIFGVIYIPPENSIYTSENALSDIELEFFELQRTNKYICLLGDFNSRTASLQDFNDLVDTDDFLAQNLIDINEFSNVDILDKLGIQRKRHSTDLNVNSYGRKLIQFCKNNNMYIMNGRIGNDEVGKPTSKNTSVVDYAISTADVLYLVENFDVLPFSSLFSDIHCPLELVLNCSNIKQSNVNINVESGENNTYIGKWNHDQVNEYKENLDKESISQLLSFIMTKTENVQNVDKNTIDEIVNEIRDVLLNSARNTFGEFVQKTYGFDYTGGKQNHRDWFNTECRRERRAFRKSKRLYKRYGSRIFKERLRRISGYHILKYFDNCMSNIWNAQFSDTWVSKCIEQKLKDQFQQECWYLLQKVETDLTFS
ncbi:unnamed protein product [Mytilus edulis]|uniref:Endonuclease/exonuclease/phosphatase domain-containing protein n=1 Tax=Mytilus edulis TaxID=6550 RepID=A0A8S3RP59_MYTED|nr:unnamed protein product [Mytilus edulis]